MYRLIIADDEEITRNGLVKTIDWQSLGFEVAGQFDDGKETLEYLKDHAVDVVFTDVQMCEISGLEVAKWVFQNLPGTKVIMLSGYREFAYVKEAMTYGVCDYILKPLNPMEIREVFSNLRILLDKQTETVQSIATLPFAYSRQKECQPALESGAQLLKAVAGGETEAVYNRHEEWYSVLMSTPSEYVPFLVSHLFEELYAHLDKLGVHLEPSLQKDQIYRQISDQKETGLFAATGRILIELASTLSKKKSPSFDALAARAKRYVEEHLAENFTVEDIASSVFLSSSYFSREFKKSTGESVLDYVIHRRMERAVQLIQENRLGLSAICRAVGYTDPKYFQRSFKKYTGYTVKEYRKLLF